MGRDCPFTIQALNPETKAWMYVIQPAKRKDTRYDPNSKAAAAAEKFTSVKNLARLSLQVKVIIDHSWEMPDSCHIFKILQPC